MWATPNSATMSLIGLYNYDNTLFDNLELPDDMDASLVAYNILMECAELEVIYPDFAFMKTAIGTWSANEVEIWKKVREMELAEYNPIENYDRYESEVENMGRNTENNKSDVINSTSDATSKTVNSGVNTRVDLNKVAGFNSETLVTNNETTNSDTNNGETNTATDSKGSSVQNTNDKGTENENRVRESRVHGNIGITTVAQMISGQLEILPKVNTLNYIVDSFKARFCLLVY